MSHVDNLALFFCTAFLPIKGKLRSVRFAVGAVKRIIFLASYAIAELLDVVCE